MQCAAVILSAILKRAILWRRASKRLVNPTSCVDFGVQPSPVSTLVITSAISPNYPSCYEEKDLAIL